MRAAKKTLHESEPIIELPTPARGKAGGSIRDVAAGLPRDGRRDMNVLPRRLLAVVALVIFAMTIGGAWFYRAQRQAFRRETGAQLLAIAQLKVNQIVQWRQERLGDSAVLAESAIWKPSRTRLGSWRPRWTRRKLSRAGISARC